MVFTESEVYGSHRGRGPDMVFTESDVAAADRAAAAPAPAAPSVAQGDAARRIGRPMPPATAQAPNEELNTNSGRAGALNDGVTALDTLRQLQHPQVLSPGWAAYSPAARVGSDRVNGGLGVVAGGLTAAQGIDNLTRQGASTDDRINGGFQVANGVLTAGGGVATMAGA